MPETPAPTLELPELPKAQAKRSNRRPVKDRLIEKTELQPDGCWKWLGTKHRTGYALLPMPTGDRWRNRRAHRVSWEVFRGPIPAGIYVCHTCDNRECTNPDHLFLGTQKDNMQDCATKNRVVNVGQSRKTHCLRGHEYAVTGVYIGNSLGHRICKACHAAAQALRYLKGIGKDRVRPEHERLVNEVGDAGFECLSCGKVWANSVRGLNKASALKHAKNCAAAIRGKG